MSAPANPHLFARGEAQRPEQCFLCGQSAEAEIHGKRAPVTLTPSAGITVTLSPREVQTIQGALDLWTYWHHPLLHLNGGGKVREAVAQRLALFAPDPLSEDECQALCDRLSGLTDGPEERLLGPALAELL